MSKNKPIACIDLDGTVVSFKDGWQGENSFGETLPGAVEAINTLAMNGWYIIIFTTRGNRENVAAHLKKIGAHIDSVNEPAPWQHSGTNRGKPAADVYVDDHGIAFRGNWKETLKQILTFRTWEQENGD